LVVIILPSIFFGNHLRAQLNQINQKINLRGLYDSAIVFYKGKDYQTSLKYFGTTANLVERQTFTDLIVVVDKQ